MNAILEVYRDKEWIKIEMCLLIIGEVFRMFDVDRTPYQDGQMWLVTKLPYLNKEEIWTVDCEPITGVTQG